MNPQMYTPAYALVRARDKSFKINKRISEIEGHILEAKKKLLQLQQQLSDVELRIVSTSKKLNISKAESIRQWATIQYQYNPRECEARLIAATEEMWSQPSV